MARDAATYDLVLLLDLEIDDETREQMVADVEGLIGADGEIVLRQDWGRRPMTFEIRHKKEADYRLVQFTGPAELLERLSRVLKITDGVLRHRIVRIAPGTPSPQEPQALEPAGDAA